MAKKPGIPFERHDELAEKLFSIREFLLKTEVELANSFPTTGVQSKPYRFIERARKDVDEARSALENLMFQDHPEKAKLGIYYNREKVSSPA